MDTSKETTPSINRQNVVFFIISLFLLAIFFIFMYGQGTSGSFNFMQGVPRTSEMREASTKDDLQVALEGASMANKTVVITVLNRAYAEGNGMLDLFLRALYKGENTTYLQHHILFVAVDQVAYDRCTTLRLHCYKLVTEGVDFSKEVVYMTPAFVKMMWSRTLLLSEVLKRGFSFIFTDMDVMWLRDPFEGLGNEGEDIQVSCDHYNGMPFNLGNVLNTGFYFMATNDQTIAFLDEWYASSNSSGGKKEQDVLNDMKNIGAFNRLRLKVRVLDTKFFAGFCQNSRGFKEVRTIHANCCRTIKAKMADLTLLLDEWERYNGTDVGLRWPEARACGRSWTEDPGK